MSLKRPQYYFVSAGEVSGDLLAAELVVELREKFPKLQAIGIAGPAMRAAGVQCLLPAEDFGIMGITAVAARLAQLRETERRIIAAIEKYQPAFCLLVDFPGFHLRLAEQLKLRGMKVFQFGAPKVWAWGRSRVEALRRDFDLVLGILPFEAEFFAVHKVPYKYIGSPVKDRVGKIIVSKPALGLDAKRPLLAVLPGSRPHELQFILPRMVEIVSALRLIFPDLMALIPLAPGLKWAEVCHIFGEEPILPDLTVPGEKRDLHGLTFTRGMSLEVMAAADAALVASGTATLECAVLGTPMAVVYALNPMSFAVMKRFVTLTSVSLVNLTAGRPIVREFIQEFSAREVADEIARVLRPGPDREAMKQDLLWLRHNLDGDAAKQAAQAIWERVGR